MSWKNLIVRNLDGRTGRIESECIESGHVELVLSVSPYLDRVSDQTSQSRIQLNMGGPDTGEWGWYWWSESFKAGEGGWLALGNALENLLPTQDGLIEQMPYTPQVLDLLMEQLKSHEEGLRSYATRGRITRLEMCKQWMIKENKLSLSHVGPLGLMPRKGQRVKLHPGIPVRTTAPSDVVIKTNRSIRVFDVNLGYADREGDVTLTRQPQICWVGTNGYWMYVQPADLKPGAFSLVPDHLV